MQNLQDAWLQAWHFAAHAHREQKLPGNDLPYLVHVAAVAMEIFAAHQQTTFRRPIVAVQCALLHDVMEDTPTDCAGSRCSLSKYGPSNWQIDASLAGGKPIKSGDL